MSTNKVEVAFSSYLMCFRMPIALLALALWTTTVSHNNHGIKPQMGFLIAQNNFKCGQISVCRVWAKQNTRQRRNAFLLFGKQPELILGKKKQDLITQMLPRAKKEWMAVVSLIEFMIWQNVLNEVVLGLQLDNMESISFMVEWFWYKISIRAISY